MAHGHMTNYPPRYISFATSDGVFIQYFFQPLNCGFGESMKKTIDLHGRTCNACWRYKKWEHYQKDKHSKSGHRACCRSCDSKKIKSTVPKRNRIQPPLEGFCPRKQAFYFGKIEGENL